ncbi:hypothetical protein L596_005500 [Steinernema carpocapsae]|uniref:Serpin domain-containing protein n=1 Tax=Steinernema carpocapsae TaxID=34508 RepID=A0A4U8UZB1_STECR|nr:hypothetical protein L596_005500 [Steinernema carpocapsae]
MCTSAFWAYLLAFWKCSKVRWIPTEKQSFSATQTDFALQLLRRNKDSSVISPFSIAAALAMVYGGAQGKTKKEMKSVFVKENTDEELHQFLSEILTKTADTSGKTYLEAANKIFPKHGFDILAKFSEHLTSHVMPISHGQSGAREAIHKPVTLLAKLRNWIPFRLSSPTGSASNRDVLTAISSLDAPLWESLGNVHSEMSTYYKALFKNGVLHTEQLNVRFDHIRNFMICAGWMVPAEYLPLEQYETVHINLKSFSCSYTVGGRFWCTDHMCQAILVANGPMA